MYVYAYINFNIYLFFNLVQIYKLLLCFINLLSNHLFLTQKQPPEASCQRGVLGDFAGFTGGGGASGGVSIFDRVAGLKPVALLTGRLWRGCFPVSFVEFQGAPSLQSASDDCFC